MFEKVLVANRATAATRVIRALRSLGVRSVAVYSEADRDLPAVAEADEAFPLGPAPARDSYLNQDRILAIARAAGVDGLHPGYGFLSENPDFARAVEAAGIRFIGPDWRSIAAMGHKSRARELMARHGMPMSPSSAILGADADAALDEARALGFPVMIKPAGGGGGIGMMAVSDEAGFPAALARARSLAERSFASSELYLERLMLRPRHIEFQIIADSHGDVRHLFERDCSVQRRHQKVIEESPAPGIAAEDLRAAAANVTASVAAAGYTNIGTVETLYTPGTGFSFLEMNTRLQVEHAVTEEVTGIDIVAAQIRLAAGARLAAVLPDPVRRQGHAIQARIYAEDPVRFFPSPGPLTVFRPPAGPGIRVETGYREGNLVTPHYDPMIAKVIAHAADRPAAIATLAEALRGFEIAGLKTNIPFILAVLGSEGFAGGQVHTGLAAEVLKAK
ncbi:MAG: biotin carboxylase [Rhodospirillales bacterium 70-18]|nr:biotin carboxylase [Rhodospirillales bacterium]OJY73091.1 MAG: biotin carboxylase [Rhodospirillales bacterium 70-18]